MRPYGSESSSVWQPGLGKVPQMWRCFGIMSTQGEIERELSSFPDLWEFFIIQTPMEMISLKSKTLRQEPGTAWLFIVLQIDIKYSAGATILKIKSFIRSSSLSIFSFDVRKIFYVSKKNLQRWVLAALLSEGIIPRLWLYITC